MHPQNILNVYSVRFLVYSVAHSIDHKQCCYNKDNYFLEMGVSVSDSFVRNWKAGSSLRFFLILSGCHS